MEKISTAKVTIGLEIHCQLTNLRTKLFCSCSANYREEEPNTLICPVCMGLPGTLPVMNEKALELTSKIALALGSKLSKDMLFFRKNYFYPDLPKNFQITQYDKVGAMPIAVGGFIPLNSLHNVKLRRIQLEEDPAKISYEGSITSSSYSLVDYNRAGIALVEIVTEPDIKSPKEARELLEKLKSILEHLEVFDGGLDGSMRCDANISIRGRGRVEVKNISSFKEVERALSFEVTRQTTLSRRDVKSMETRHWDDARRVTVSLRNKEEEEEYRYFPEPDLLPVIFSDEYVTRVKDQLLELPDDRRERLVHDYGITAQASDVLTRNKALADFFEASVSIYSSNKRISNWLAGDILAYMNRKGKKIDELKITASALVELVQMVDEEVLSERTGKNVLFDVLETGFSPKDIVKEKGLERVSDEDYIEKLTSEVFDKNPKPVQDSLKNEKTIHFLLGLVMKAAKGKVDPKEARDKIVQKLGTLKQ